MVLQEGELRLYARGPLMGMPHAMLQNRLSLSPSQIADLRLAASKMTGPARRAFEAEMTLKYCAGNPLMAEAVFGWGRQTVALGLGACPRISVIGSLIPGLACRSHAQMGHHP